MWREKLRTNFTNWETLAAFLELNDEQKKEIIENRKFPLNLPKRLAEKIKKRTLTDPILRQFLPTKNELIVTPGFSLDPVGDQQKRCTSKLLHKYEGRVLLVTTGACAMHCRYCFRQKFDYDAATKGFENELRYIEKDNTLREVILSGGDPLSLSDEKLESLLKRIQEIPHIRRVRFHTRFPLGIPERIDNSFLNVLSAYPLQLLFVIHANHPDEFDKDIVASLKRLQKIGATLLCQSVLLRGVNDNVNTLVRLSETLVNNGIIPYYLHQLDRTQGTSHFEVPEEEGNALMENLVKKLPGYAVPRYVREVAGEPSKISLV